MVYYIDGVKEMINKLLNAINDYNTIIIHRHQRPDLDALGSQVGLATALKDSFPEKHIYMVGDSSIKYGFIGTMDEIEDEVYKDALVIIVDVAVARMVSDERFKLAKEVFVIDHHKNECDVTENTVVDTQRVAAAELVADILINAGYKISPEAATALYGGIVTDSGRFMYGDRLDRTFQIASRLIALGARPKYIYDNIYIETLKDREMKNYFSNKFEIKDGVAFLKNGPEVFDLFPREFNDISRGMLSCMSGIDEIKIWLNFTFDKDKNAIIGEFRSRSLPIVDIAKKYGGGGHALACGATIESWEKVDEVINDFVGLLNNGEVNEG